MVLVGVLWARCIGDVARGHVGGVLRLAVVAVVSRRTAVRGTLSQWLP